MRVTVYLTEYTNVVDSLPPSKISTPFLPPHILDRPGLVEANYTPLFFFYTLFHSSGYMLPTYSNFPIVHL